MSVYLLIISLFGMVVSLTDGVEVKPSEVDWFYDEYGMFVLMRLMLRL